MSLEGRNDERRVKVRSYKDLVVWRKSMTMVKQIYGLPRSFPSDERFGLISQMRRAAVSVPSNIAEGQSRHTGGEFVQFISHAEGILSLIDELQRMLNGLRQKLATRH